MGRGSSNGANAMAAPARTLTRQSALTLENYLNGTGSVTGQEATQAKAALEGLENELSLDYWGTKAQCVEIEAKMRAMAHHLGLEITNLIQTKKGLVQQAYTIYVEGDMIKLIIFKSEVSNVIKAAA